MTESRKYRPELPEPKPITLSAKRTAVLIVDVQNDYQSKEGVLYAGELADRAIPHLEVLIHKARAAGAPVIYTKNLFAIDDPVFEMPWWAWPKHCIEGTWGAEIIDSVKPATDEEGVYIINKKYYDAFADPSWGMEAKLKELNVKNIVISGTATNLCVLHTAGGAAQRGYNLILPIDCVATFGEFDQDAGIYQITMPYSAQTTTAELITFE
jgi:nicotinamidase-related amidase